MSYTKGNLHILSMFLYRLMTQAKVSGGREFVKSMEKITWKGVLHRTLKAKIIID